MLVTGQSQRPWNPGEFAEWFITREVPVLLEPLIKFLTPIIEHLRTAGLGHVSEIADAEAPHEPRGCPFQAWSVAETLRLLRGVLAEEEEAQQPAVALV